MWLPSEIDIFLEESDLHLEAARYLGYANAVYFFIMVIVYAPYRSVFPTEEYFRRRRYENVITEYNVIKDLLFIAVPIFVFFTILNTVMLGFQSDFLQYIVTLMGGILLAGMILVPLTIIVIAGLTRIFLQVMKKDFRWYFAKGCFMTASQKEDDVEKMKYIILGLNAYNSFLRRYLKLEIEDLKKIYSRISSEPRSEKTKIIDSFCKAFESDKLQPLSNLMALLKISEPDKLLAKQPFIHKIKEAAAFAAVVIPILISVITLILDNIFKTT